MVGLVYEAAFRDLRELADWFSRSPQGSSSHIEHIVTRLGVLAIPLLGRELCSTVPLRRAAARDALAAIAAQGASAHARVAAALQPITVGPVADEAKVIALGLLSQLGEHADVRFADPQAIRARSAIALAAHLETAADLASAVDLMVHQLEAGEIMQMLEVMAEAAPSAAHRLARELGIRIDVPGDVRDRIMLLVATIAPKLPPEADAPAPELRRAELVHATVLGDAAARLVVIASRKLPGELRWRRWAVQIGVSGRIEDCVHEDDAGPDGDPTSLFATLGADGYHIASTSLDHARAVVAAAARRTTEAVQALPSPYYLGRDLLDLADAHLGARGRAHPASALLARAIELVAAGDAARALPLLERCDPDHPDAAAALAAALLAQHRPAAAIAALDRALAAEPDWPLHHWNLAAALHQLGDTRGCYHALRRFIATSAAPSGLAADPAQPARLGCAERLIAELERTARVTGRSLRGRSVRGRSLRRRPRAARKKRGSAST
jgi:tetratricopeptide (TPR) repeat protein